MTQAISATLAGFVAEFGTLPVAVEHETRRALLNGLAAGLGGSADRAIASLWATLEPLSGPKTASILGRKWRADCATATFINAAAMNVLDFDDTHVGTIIHPTAPVAAAVLALAEQRGSSGADTLRAIALGIEVACRIGNAVSPEHYARGWHITATCGVFGAAMGCARLLGLDARRTLWALGNASAQSSGLVETLGTMAKSVGVGHAARAGLMAALFSQNGVEGPQRPLEGRLGFVPVTADTPRPERAVDGLGTRWELARNMYKPYPCGVVLNPLIDACLELRGMPGFDATRIRRIAVTGSELLRMRTDRPDVHEGREAQVSAQHAAAVALLRGSAGPADFGDEAVGDADVLAVRAKVGQIEVDPAMPEDAVRIGLELDTGDVLERLVCVARGSLEKPLSTTQLEDKLRSLAAHGRTGVDADAVVEALDGLADAVDTQVLMSTLRPPESSQS